MQEFTGLSIHACAAAVLHGMWQERRAAVQFGLSERGAGGGVRQFAWSLRKTSSANYTTKMAIFLDSAPGVTYAIAHSRHCSPVALVQIKSSST